MKNDISIEGTSRHKDSEIPLGKHTLNRGDDTPIHDVEDLLNCIKLWKESAENPKLSMLERFQKWSTPNINSSNLLLNDEIKKFNNSISDGLLKLEEYETKEEKDKNEQSINHYDTSEYDKKKIISDLNYPIDLNYQKYLLDNIGDKEYDDIESSSDTRFGTDGSDSENNTYKTSTFTTENETTIGNQIEYKGKKIDPEIMYKNKFTQDIVYSKNGNNIKHVDYNNPNYEINRLEDSDNVDYREVEEFNGMIGELINDENYQFSSQSESNELIKKQMEKKEELSKKQYEQDNMLVGEIIVPEREYGDEEFENEENPILTMKNREDAIITENDILSYGKSESTTEFLPSDMIEKRTDNKENKKEMIKDISVNCQIDQILSTKEKEPEVEKVRGVCYCKSDNSWTAWWTEKGKSRKKAFKLSLYGYDQARKLAIEHRKQIEVMIPELKEKRVKAGKRKVPGNKTTETNDVQNNANINGQNINKSNNKDTSSNKINDPNMSNNAINVNNGNLSNRNTLHTQSQTKTQASIEKRKQPINEDGIYRGTRNKIRKTLEDQGIYFRDNIWYSTWIDSLGNRVVNSFPVTSELPFLAAKGKAINSCTFINQAIAGNNNNYPVQDNIKGPKFKGNNANYLNNLSFRNYEILKRKKRQLNSSVSSISEGFDHLKNLEKKLEEMERYKLSSTHLGNMERQGQINTQSATVPQIFVQTPQELKLTSFESKQGNTETKICPKLSSLHCQIKLDRATIKKIENAINQSILQKTNQEEKETQENGMETVRSEVLAEKQIRDNETKEIRTNYEKELKDLETGANTERCESEALGQMDSTRSSNGNLDFIDSEGLEGFKRKEGTQGYLREQSMEEQTQLEEKNLENVNALCITQTHSDRRTSINIIPTYIMGPQDTQLLTFVILNS